MTTRARPRKYSTIIREGDALASLEATRDQIAVDLEMCESMRDKTALYARMTDVLSRIEELKPPKPKGDVVDEIAARRSARRAGTAKSSSRAQRPG